MSWSCVLGGCSDDASPPQKNPHTPEGIAVNIKRPLKLRDEARIPQNDPSFDRAEVSADSITFHYKAAPTIALAAGHIVAGNGAQPYLRRLAQVVSASASRVEVRTEPASLTDLISDGAFEVIATPAASDWVVDAENGISGRKLFLDTKLKLLAFGDDNAFNCELAGAGGLELSPKLEPAINQFKFDVDIEPTLVPIGAELVSANFLIDAELTAGLLAKVSRAVSAQCEVDFVKFLGNKLGKENVLMLEWSFAFAIGPIPVQLTVKVQPVLKLEGGVEAKVEVTFAPEMTVGAKAGVAYTRPQSIAQGGGTGGWTDTFEVSKSGSLTPTFSDVGGEVSLSAKISAGMKLALLLYDTAGPTIALTHFGEGKLAAKVPECTWNATLSIGTDVTLGAEVQVPVFDKTVLELQKKFNLATLKVKEATGPLPACADAGVEAGPEAGVDAGPDAGADAALDATLDGAADAQADGGADLGSDGGVGDAQAPASCPDGWCEVVAGTFTMGSPATEPCRRTDEAQHEVTLSRGFEMQQTEVTQDQFQTVMGYNPSWFSTTGSGATCGANCPVERVSWHEAVAYCNALSSQASLDPCYSCSGSGATVSCTIATAYADSAIYTCPGYRLPTEAEFERAYRAGTGAAFYSGGNDAALCTSCASVDANLGTIAWYCANSGNITHPVAGKAPNALGLHDLAGNVREWCHDAYVSDLGTAPVTDPFNVGTLTDRGVRGGAWAGASAGTARELRAAARRASSASGRSQTTGFRCVRTLPLPPPELYWAFDGNVSDASGNGHDGTPAGLTYATGVVGSAATFDGSTAWVGNASLAQSWPMTVSVWIKPALLPTDPDWAVVNQGRDTGSAWSGWSLHLDQGGPMIFGSFIGQNTVKFVGTNTSMPLNGWTHVVGVFDGGTVSVYVNGQLESSASGSAITWGPQGLVVGRDGYLQSRYFQGALDELAIWHAALTDVQVDDVYKLGQSGKPIQ